MAWIKMIGVDEATGLLKRIFESTIKRAGRVWNITGIMSQNPRVMRSSMELYGTIMKGSSELSRGQREMLAVVVSVRNHCEY